MKRAAEDPNVFEMPHTATFLTSPTISYICQISVGFVGCFAALDSEQESCFKLKLFWPE